MNKCYICILTYKELDDLVREAMKQYADPNVHVEIIEGHGDGLLSIIKQKLFAGCEAFIAGGSNARFVKDHSDLPVVDFELSSIDYITELLRLTNYEGHIIIAGNKDSFPPDLLSFLHEFFPNVELVEYETEDDLNFFLERYQSACVIGTALPVDIARKRGLNGILVYPGIECVLQTINKAVEIVQQVKRAKQKSDILQTMMTYSTDGFLIINEKRKIIDINVSARTLLQMESRNVKGEDINTVFPELNLETSVEIGKIDYTEIITVNGKNLLVHIVKIVDVLNCFKGATIILTNLSDLNKLTMEFRESQAKQKKESGFIAHYNFGDIRGQSSAILECIKDAQLFSASEENLLIQGETGTGKELFAQSIHNHSARNHGPFIALNCAALPETLLEAELFGYDEGAFTGGRRGGKQGLLELANKGTIFLDEISELAPNLQTKLLRAIQEKQILHLGGNKMIPVNVRVISATNSDLENGSHQAFRKDLFYRISVLNLIIPPLRDRGKDVEVLFSFFVQQSLGLCDPYLGNVPIISEILTTYQWPGNIRELQNVCKRFILFRSKMTKPDEKNTVKNLVKAIGNEKLLKTVLEKYPNHTTKANPELIGALKRIFNFTQTEIAEILGISRTTLWRSLSS